MRVWIHELPECDDILPIYQIDDEGNVYSRSRQKDGEQLSRRVGDSGYLVVSLRKLDGRYALKSIHRLLALAFVVGYEERLQVDHIDGDKSNNAIDNLRWSTSSENINNPNTKQKMEFVQNSVAVKIVNIKTGVEHIFASMKDLADFFSMNKSSIRIALRKGYTVGKEWRVYEL